MTVQNIRTKQRPACPHCGVPLWPDSTWCYCCERQLVAVEDWNPTPGQWFAAVGAYLIDRAALVPGQMRELAGLAAVQGSNAAVLAHDATMRLLAEIAAVQDQDAALLTTTLEERR